MITKEQIKKDLDEIRYYHAKKIHYEKLGKNFEDLPIKSLIEKYNDAISKAPLKITEVYIEIYINGSTYENAAENLYYSVNYIYRLNKKILDYFISFFNDKK